MHIWSSLLSVLVLVATALSACEGGQTGGEGAAGVQVPDSGARSDARVPPPCGASAVDAQHMISRCTDGGHAEAEDADAGVVACGCDDVEGQPP